MRVTSEAREAAAALTADEIGEVVMDQRFDEAVDGCTVYELDGTCEHGHAGLAAIAMGLA